LKYPDAIDLLLSMVDHERSQPSGPRQKAIFDLGRMERLLQKLGAPQNASPVIHVAGTKGKGSTAALCDSALHAAGYHTGFYSSPHLHSFRERIRRNTNPISKDEFSGLVEELWPHQEWIGQNEELGPITLFEFLTGMAFQCFSENKTDFQVIEVGLGGRLDATNVVSADVSVITSISLDHTAILGDTIGEIAREKAGIVKAGATVVIAPQRTEALSVILDVCESLSATTIQVGKDVTWSPGPASIDGQELTVDGRSKAYDLKIPLLGKYQMENTATAVAVLEALQEQGHSIPDDAIQRGFADVAWPCRMEVLGRDPLVMADGAHNEYSMDSLLESLESYVSFRRLILVVGFSRDKSVANMVRRLAETNPVVFASRSRHPRSTAPAHIASLFKEHGIQATVTASSAEAVTLAMNEADEGDLVLATGSLFVAAEVREKILGIEPELYPDLLPADLRIN
jgi:dihydrofolate synthase/folylpolyglutamate synthase